MDFYLTETGDPRWLEDRDHSVEEVRLFIRVLYAASGICHARIIPSEEAWIYECKMEIAG